MTSRVALPLVLSGAVLSICSVIAAAQAPRALEPGSQHTKKSVPVVVQDAGERKFQQNCGRCHTAPEQLSPRITGTVVRHMRVRASLSAQDERDILHYLSP